MKVKKRGKVYKYSYYACPICYKSYEDKEDANDCCYNSNYQCLKCYRWYKTKDEAKNCSCNNKEESK